jgi:hypothetical protein
MPNAVITAESVSDNIGKHLHTVVTDCRDTESLSPVAGKRSLQLHELRFAVWSPIGRAEEQQGQTLWPFCPIEVVHRAVMSVERKQTGHAKELLQNEHLVSDARSRVRHSV